MEKFSAYRDAGTGIQPFLTPVPVQSDNQVISHALKPISYIFGVARTLLVLLLGLVYLLTVNVLAVPFMIIPPLHRGISYLSTALTMRLILLLLGFWWIPVEMWQKKRGRGVPMNESWKPRAGDLIISNWVSWVELLWLAFRFNPVFVLPIAEPLEPSSGTTSPAVTPGRKTGTGSAAISAPPPTARARAPILGFKEVSLWQMICATGNTPVNFATDEPRPLEDIRMSARAPVVVFPECTTSNGRALLRYAEVFGEKATVPVRKYGVFVMCVRYDPPTSTTPTLTHSIPARILNPLPHLFRLTASFNPSASISIRLLTPSESPSSGAFIASDYVSGNTKDELSEACAGLTAQMGKMKRTGMGWEDKTAFLEFYRSRRS